MAGFKSPAVDPSSPVYQDVVSAERHPGPYPTFAEIPRTPTDVRPVSAWASAVAGVEADKARLDAGVAALPPAETDTEAFAANAREAVRPPAVHAAPADAADTEAYVKSLKARATPPPKRRAHQR